MNLNCINNFVLANINYKTESLQVIFTIYIYKFLNDCTCNFTCSYIYNNYCLVLKSFYTRYWPSINYILYASFKQ